MFTAKQPNFKHLRAIYDVLIDELARTKKFDVIENLQKGRIREKSTSGILVAVIRLYGRSGMLGNALKTFHEISYYNHPVLGVHFPSSVMASINRQMRLLSQMCYSSLASQTTSIQWGIQGVDRKPWKTIKKEEPKSRNMQWTFLGCPGVGKRTYASRLSKPLGDPHIAIGDLVREELAQSGPPANKDTQICSVIFSNNCQESSAIPYCNQPVASSFHDIMLPSRVEKVVHNKKISELLQKYTQVIVCLADNVASNQLQSIRRHLRPDSVVLMGKNTVMKRSVERYGGKSENTSYENMVPLLVGNVALIFTRGNLREVCEKGALITKFGTRPLSRGLIVKAIYGGGSVFDPTVLDLIEDDSVDNISASISLWQPFFWLSTILQ